MHMYVANILIQGPLLVASLNMDGCTCVFHCVMGKVGYFGVWGVVGIFTEHVAMSLPCAIRYWIGISLCLSDDSLK